MYGIRDTPEYARLVELKDRVKALEAELAQKDKIIERLQNAAAKAKRGHNDT